MPFARESELLAGKTLPLGVVAAPDRQHGLNLQTAAENVRLGGEAGHTLRFKRVMGRLVELAFDLIEMPEVPVRQRQQSRFAELLSDTQTGLSGRFRTCGLV